MSKGIEQLKEELSKRVKQDEVEQIEENIEMNEEKTFLFFGVVLDRVPTRKKIKKALTKLVDKLNK